MAVDLVEVEAGTLMLIYSAKFFPNMDTQHSLVCTYLIKIINLLHQLVIPITLNNGSPHLMVTIVFLKMSGQGLLCNQEMFPISPMHQVPLL